MMMIVSDPTLSGVALVTPFHPVDGSARGAFSDWEAWTWSWFIRA